MECTKCGNCCLEWGAYFVIIPEEDIQRWENEGRKDILQYLQFLEGGNASGWVNPQTKDQLSRCPFLCKIDKSSYLCTIHDTKPKRCKEPYDYL